MTYHYSSLASQKGVALIQVLLISAVISILAIRFSYTAREQIEIASAYQDRVTASLALRSTQNRIIYLLLGHDDFSHLSTDVPVKGHWNFYGQPFWLDDNTEVTLQDHNGLLSMLSPYDPLWPKVLQQIGYSDYDVRRVLGEMQDYQDADHKSWIAGNVEPNAAQGDVTYRNSLLQLPQELDWIFQSDPQKLELVKSVSIPIYHATFNPLLAPELIFRACVGPELSDQLLASRDQGELTGNTLRPLLNGVDEENITFLRGSTVRLTVMKFVGDVRLSETIDIKIQRKKPIPMLLLYRN
jgi:general secretion pathway protein K